jgi:hypothetical protein
MQRMRASRLCRSQFERHWRLARTADGGRSAAMQHFDNSFTEALQIILEFH